MAGAHLAKAQFFRTILAGADLHGADLRGVLMDGAALNDANLTGANLQGADMRGAVGIDAQQICSAQNLRQIQLSENAERDVEALCPGRR